MTRGRRGAISGAAAIAMVLAGCAGDDEAGPTAASDETSDETPEEAAATPDEDPEDPEDPDDTPGADELTPAADGDSDPLEHDHAQPRLVLADADSATVTFLDLGTGDLAGDLVLDAPVLTHGASLTADGRYLLAPHEDGVSIVDSGTWSTAHGSHAHHYTSRPEIVGWIDGPNPSHLVSADGRSALFFDGSGETIVLDEAAFVDRDLDAVETIATDEPHHGFTVPLGESAMVTVPTDDMEGMPNVVGVADATGEVDATFDCANTHGETVMDGGAAAACQDGVLLVTGDDERWEGTLVAYPEVDDEDPYGYDNARAWVLGAAPGGQRLVAPLGARHVLDLDPASAEARALSVDHDVALFGVGVDADDRVIVLTQDGAIQAFDPDDGDVVARAAVIDAFAEGDTSEPFRRLVIHHDHAYVSDPTTRSVIEVALDDLTVTRSFELDITPGYLGISTG